MNSPILDSLILECLVHDLNNVFQTVADAGDMLSRDPKWAPLAAVILRSVEQGKGVLTTIASSQNAADVKLEESLTHAVQFSRDFLAAARISGIEFATGIEPGLRVRCSQPALQRVLINLFLNAAQSMPAGGTVETLARSVGGRVDIEVGDHGPGIPLEILSEIFKPGFSTQPAHSGLGLHIVERLVRENAGSVVARNRAGDTGAVFTVSLPAAEVEQGLPCS